MRLLLISLLIIITSTACRDRQVHSSLDYSRAHDEESVIVSAPHCQKNADCTKSFKRSYKLLSRNISSVKKIMPLSRNSSLFAVFLKEISVRKAVDVFKTYSSVDFVSLNYEYRDIRGDAQMSNLEMSQRTMQHLETISWQFPEYTSSNTPVLIAVPDDGFDLDHDDLQETFFANKGEVGLDENGLDKASNGIDDDNNGYVDDYQGWDFTGKEDNNPRPKQGDYHGTHIAGIIAADSNDVGAQGVAPGVKVLPIRFSGDGVWSSLRVARAYNYALEMGAKIISSSYAIDYFVDDPVFELVLDRLYNQGMLIFNSAGNNRTLNPARQSFESLILVGNTYAKNSRRDEINPNSNYGVGIDIYAPGDIYSTLPGNKYGYRTGTSMATPVAAAVAALIWSKNPSWTRDQVAAQLLGTADSILSKNEDKREYLGNGRISSSKAAFGNPRTAKLKLLSKVISEQQGEILLKIDGIIDESQVNKRHFFVFDEDSKGVPFKWAKPYKVGSNILRLQLPNVTIGDYKLVVAKNLRTPFAKLISESTQRFRFKVVESSDDLLGEVQVEATSGSFYQDEDIKLNLSIGDTSTYAFIKVTGIILSTSTGDKFPIHGNIERQGGEYKLRFPSFKNEIPADQYHLGQITLSDHYQQNFVLAPYNYEHITFKVRDNTERESATPSILGINFGRETWSKFEEVTAIVEYKPGKKLKELNVEIRGEDSYLSFSNNGKFKDLGDSRYLVSFDVSGLQDRETLYVSKVLSMESSGLRSNLFGRPRQRYFLNTKIENDSVYIVDDLLSDISKPIIESVKFVSQNPVNNEVTVLVKAYDLDSELRSVKVSLSGYLDLINSSAFTPHGSVPSSRVLCNEQLSRNFRTL